MRFSAPPDILTIVNAEIESRLQHARAEGIGRVRERNACGNCGESLGQWDCGTCPLCSAALEKHRAKLATGPMVSEARTVPVRARAEASVPMPVAKQVTLFGVEPVIKKGKRK